MSKRVPGRVVRRERSGAAPWRPQWFARLEFERTTALITPVCSTSACSSWHSICAAQHRNLRRASRRRIGAAILYPMIALKGGRVLGRSRLARL